MASMLRPTPRRWLVAAHILCCVLWLGTAIAALARTLLVIHPTADPALARGAFAVMTRLDDTVLRAGAFGTALTGVALDCSRGTA